MKASLTLATFAVVLVCGLPAQQRYTFGNIPWGANRAAVTEAMRQTGLKFSKVDEDGDLLFQGNLNGYDARVWALMTPTDQLSKTGVTLITEDSKARGVYRDMKDVLTKKYGAPTNCEEHFSDPYHEGDGYEEQAIKLGKGFFMCLWGDEITGVLGIEITDQLNVHITYEFPGWYAGEAARRKAIATKAF